MRLAKHSLDSEPKIGLWNIWNPSLVGTGISGEVSSIWIFNRNQGVSNLLSVENLAVHPPAHLWFEILLPEPFEPPKSQNIQYLRGQKISGSFGARNYRCIHTSYFSMHFLNNFLIVPLPHRKSSIVKSPSLPHYGLKIIVYCLGDLES